ncbi:hypothetical protein TSUD_263830 [Trifolium subterraneum]|uniref:Uncharacterized protein n=1 Tax=Trifolium subterraneum TaxID=3900 RepID=A0A2Z6P3B4_TRISU|nr:hypothetical protein TSUD_263830 [Trifolium subterraneum]
MRITLVSFLLSCCSIYITHTSPECLEDQQSLLLQLKNNFTFLDKKPLYSPIIDEIISPSTKLRTWNKRTACCNWSGVTCDNDGHVISLDLSGEHIVGGFNNSSSLFNLVHLQKLNLDDNNFNSSIPSGFSKLERLTYLNLSMAGFVGHIPMEISQLTRLVTLDLSFISHSTKSQIPNLPKLVQNLTKIGKLYLDDISIISQGPEWSSALLPLRDLQELSMYNCDLSGPLDSSLAKLENLSVIILDGNNFSSPIPENFASLKHLTTLGLSDCGLNGTFPQKMFQIETLRILDISFNLNLQGSFPEFALSGSIHTLLVSFTSFSGEIPRTIGHLPMPIFQIRSLLVLWLSSNRLDGSLQLDAISELRNLIALSLSRNNLSLNVNLANIFELPWKSLTWANSKVSIPLLIIRENKPWKNIQIVDIAFNNFNGKLQEKYFTTWEKMMHDEDHVVPKFIQRSSIYLSYKDSVTVSTKGQQVELVKILTIFTAIDFSSNHFEGPIPEVLMDFKAIHVLNFSNNALSGEIPSTIGNLKQLESLDLSNNSLVGEIPVQIASLSFLSYLNLSFNHLVGKIPTGTQLQSFEASSFEGNDGLYGPPLTEKPDGKRQDLLPHPACGRLDCSNDQNFLCVELGFVFGLGIIIGPIMFWKQWRFDNSSVASDLKVCASDAVSLGSDLLDSEFVDAVES